MKKLLLTVALAFGAIGAAQAQVHFDSGSARPNNLHSGFHEVQYHPHGPRPHLVRCRDGSRRIARMCRGHGGVRR